MQFNLRGALFLLAIVAFSAVGVRYLNEFFDTTARWGFLGMLGLYLLFRGEAFRALGTSFGPMLAIYIAWCLATTLWSDVPQLSLMKGLAFAGTTLIFASAGYVWSTHWRPDAPLSYLLPLVAIALMAGLGDRPEIEEVGETMELYRGLSGNPNYLGTLVAGSMPFALYQFYRAYSERSSLFARLGSAGLIILLAAFLWFAASRASLLAILITTAIFIAALSAEKRTFLIVLVGLVAVSTPIIAPQIQEGVYSRLVVKSFEGDDIFYTRRAPWEASWRAAAEGGIAGLGYGVSYGHEQFDFGFTANNYGREKGNSQLAIWEETGLAGVVLYVALLLAIFAELYRGMRFAPTQDARVQQALILGLALGLTANSVFEAWWTSPGSLGSAVFWSTVGVGAGLTRRFMTAAFQESESGAAARMNETPAASGVAQSRNW